MLTSKIFPIPLMHGVGFFSAEKIDELSGYKYEEVKGHHNYYFTKENYSWPIEIDNSTIGKLIDGFSPNLNKKLHAGHIKNLAVASALVQTLGANAIAMLGASLGVNDNAMKDYWKWCKIAGYNPTIIFDIDLPPPDIELSEGQDKHFGCKMYNNVVVYKSDGKSTYAAHDLSFSQKYKPDFYLTGAEQKEHFQSIGLGEKHIPLGLVLGEDRKKLKSRDGEAFLADNLFLSVMNSLKDGSSQERLAWNIIAWNFNSSATHLNTPFNPLIWTKPESPGMYISYTYARIWSALNKTDVEGDISQIQDDDINLLGCASYYTYYLNKARQQKQPLHIAHFAHMLAQEITGAYTRERIIGGRSGLVASLHMALNVLGQAMACLKMYQLNEV